MNKKQYITPETEIVAVHAYPSLLRLSYVQVGRGQGANFIIEEDIPIDEENDDETFDDNTAY